MDSHSPIRACPRPDRGMRTGYMGMTEVGARCIVPKLNGKIPRKKGTIHCAPTIQIKAINLYFNTNDYRGEK